MQIVVGLGNPGEKFKNSRHNVGFMILDKLAEKKDLDWTENKKLKAFIAKDSGTIFAKPSTYMNNSGEAVGAIMNYYKLLPKKLGLIKERKANLENVLTVIHDELDIEIGKTKESLNSRSAGHRGVESVIQHLKTKNFKRIRVGIKNHKPEQMPVEKYVLQNFSNEELIIIDGVINKLLIEI